MTVNLATGAATVVGPSGLSTFGSGIASDASGTLYFAGNGASGALRTVNRTTGAPSAGITMTGSPQGDAVPSLAFQPGTGVLYGLDGLDGNSTVFLTTIDPATGAVTSRGQTVTNADAIAFDTGGTLPPPVAVAPIPTLSDFALLLLSLAVATVGYLAYSRRQRM